MLTYREHRRALRAEAYASTRAWLLELMHAGVRSKNPPVILVDIPFEAPDDVAEVTFEIEA